MKNRHRKIKRERREAEAEAEKKRALYLKKMLYRFVLLNFGIGIM